MENERCVRLEVHPPVAEIILNRPDQRNAINYPLLEQLEEALQRVDGDEAIHVALVRGAGPAFCAGNDLKERATMSVDELRIRRQEGRRIYAGIEKVSKPCIAVVHGPAVAAGCEIALACDFIIAGESASFRYPVGVRGSLADTLRLPHIVGKAMAKELLFSGRLVNAQEAFSVRLVNRVVPDAQLDDVVRDLAMTIAENHPNAMTLTKRAIDEGMAADPASASRMEQEAINAAIAFQSEHSGGSSN